MTNEELEHGSFEIENRIRNLMWTISGDYDLDTKPDVTSFYKSKYISIYDAIKQGAFSRFFDKDAFALYLLKKVYLGADESQLVTLGQICVEAACHDKIAKERPGVPDIRKKAFEAIMDHDFEKMLDTYTGKVKLAYMREALTGRAPADSRVIRPFEQLKRLEQAQKTEELVQAVDWFYNQMVDPTFEKRVGDLEKVLSVSTEELSGFDWQDFLEEEAAEDAYRRMQHQLADAMTSFSEKEKEKKEQVKTYLDSLKTRYQSLNQLFFCEDYLIDGILTDFAAFCKQQEIEADILFQNYHRGNIQIEDIVDILLKFIKYAKIAGKVQLHVAAVKNQLIFSMKLTEKNMGKTAIYISKRLFKKYIKKYDGEIQLEKNNEELI